MPQFNYKARDPQGALVEGQMEGENAAAIRLQLSERGLFPTLVDAQTITFRFPSFLKRRKAFRIKELIAFTRQFSSLFKAGVPMDRTLGTLARQAESEDFKNVILAVQKDVSSGTSLTQAFAKHPQYFDDLYVNMLNVGEQGGVLDKVLLSLSGILKRDFRIMASVKSATLYPKIVLVAFVGVVTFLMMFVMPAFADFYAGFNAKLPLPTLVLIGISDFFVNYWYILLGMILFFVVLYKKYSATPSGKFKVDQIKLKVPVFGKLNILVANARFGHLVGALYQSGLPLSKALGIVANTIGNLVYKKQIESVQHSVDQGGTMSAAMSEQHNFTPFMIETVATGEQTGSLDEVLNTTSEFYDEEVSDMLDRLTTLLEPLLLVGLFGMIALLAFAVFLPIWKTTQLILPS